MNTVWLRSLMRRYGIPGLLFVAVYLAVYTLWKRGVEPLRAVARRCGAWIVVIVIGSQGVLLLVGNRGPRPESDFMAAIQQKRLQVAIKMLEDGADPNDYYDDLSNAPCVVSRPTALELAVAADQIPLVQALFRHGAHPTVEHRGDLLSIASLFEKDDMLRVLLAHGLPINAKERDCSRTALMDVVWNDNAARGAERLVDAGADVNQTDASGTTALMFAALKGDLPLVRLLLAKGADPNKNSGDGVSALSWAKAYHYSAIITLLKQRGARE